MRSSLIVAIDAFDWELFWELEATPFISSLLKEKSLYGRLVPAPIPYTPFSFFEFYTGQENRTKPTNNKFQTIAKGALYTPDPNIFSDLELLYDVGILELPLLGRLRQLGKVWVASFLGSTYANYNLQVRTHPRTLRKYVERYPPYYSLSFGQNFHYPWHFNREMGRLLYFRAILADYPCNLVGTYIRILDEFCHRFPNEIEVTTEIYEKPLHTLYSFIDSWLEILITQIIKPEVLLLWSDHGFDPRKNQGRDWEAHNHNGFYLLHGTDLQGEEERRIWQLHWLTKEVCGLGENLEQYVADLKIKIRNMISTNMRVSK